jgi:Uma2 family endonuclease
MAQLQTNRVSREPVDELRSGDHLTQQEFHRIYEKMPPDFKAELIGGIVYVTPPTSYSHGQHHLTLGAILCAYEASTPGAQAGDNTTIILSEDSEPQPDLFLRISPECGGQSRTNEEDYVLGPPELAVEISYSTHALDLHSKRKVYARYGILEYLVLSLKEGQLRWFDLRNDKELTLDADGICRVCVFPGLWIHAEGLLQRNYQQLMATLQQGLQTREHAEFVTQLAAKKKPVA